jgi:hypothetical protein
LILPDARHAHRDHRLYGDDSNAQQSVPQSQLLDVSRHIDSCPSVLEVLPFIYAPLESTLSTVRTEADSGREHTRLCFARRILCFATASCGRAIASSSSSQSSVSDVLRSFVLVLISTQTQLGIDIMLASLSCQVVSLLLFVSCCNLTEFAFRVCAFSRTFGHPYISSMKSINRIDSPSSINNR